MHVAVALGVAVAMLHLGTAQAQDNRLLASESRILLLAPHLESIRPLYQYFGWNAQKSVETAYGGVAREDAPPGRAQVFFHQTAPLTYWRIGEALDAAWIRNAMTVFKNKEVTMVVPPPSSGPFVRSGRFEVEGAMCAVFELRHVSNDVGAPTLEQRQSFSGIYCPPRGVGLDDALLRRVFEGIFVRRDGRIERAMRGVDKPIPAQLITTDPRQG
jgi:hypothetical protein